MLEIYKFNSLPSCSCALAEGAARRTHKEPCHAITLTPQFCLLQAAIHVQKIICQRTLVLRATQIIFMTCITRSIHSFPHSVTATFDPSLHCTAVTSLRFFHVLTFYSPVRHRILRHWKCGPRIGVSSFITPQLLLRQVPLARHTALPTCTRCTDLHVCTRCICSMLLYLFLFTI